MAAPAEAWPQAEPVDPTSAAKTGFSAYSKRFPAMLGAWGIAAVVSLVGALLLRAYMAGQGIDAAFLESWNAGDPLPLTFEQQMAVLGVGLPLFFASAVASLVAWGLVARVVSRHVAPEKELPPVPWGPLVLLGSALVLLYAVGMLLFVVPFLVFFHWFLFAPAVLATRGGSVGEAFEASRRFAKERRTMGFTALVLFVWLGLVIMGGIASLAFGGILGALGVPPSWAADIASPLGSWLFMPLMAAMPAAFWILGQRRGAASPGAAPAYGEARATPVEVTPEQAARSATERFRTTKCPQCGTLVPYTATGQPVDVTCPVCNRSGRVL